MKFTFDAEKADFQRNSVGCFVTIPTESLKSQQDIQKFLAESKGKYDCEITKHHEMRSDDANKYCWVLLDKLSKVLLLSAEEIYKSLIPSIGGNNYIVPIRDDALEAWIYTWEHVPKQKIGWMCKIIGKCKNVEGYSNVLNYFGSSMYNTAQMYRLIKLIVQECEQQGIETKTPAEIERLVASWKAANE